MTSKLTSEILDDETLAELIAFRRSRVEYCQKEGLPYQKALHDSMMLALEELQERRKVERDTEPYGFTDGDRRGMIYKPEHSDRLSEPVPVYRHAQPVPVVMDDTKLRELFDSWFASDCSFDLPPEASEADNIAWRESYWYVWQRCRAAMLQELKKSAGAEATCRSNENVQDPHAGNPPVNDVTAGKLFTNGDVVTAESLTTINPAPDLVSLQKKAESIIGNYPGIPDGSEHCPCCGKKLRRACSVEGCGGKHVAHGLCQKHYDMKRWEDPEQVERFREAGRRYRGKKKSTEATPQEPKP
ncbi:hypothetical protein ACPZ8C_01955 [Klebsiella pneumoniae subsp. pneumoniae]|uniref:hypothetical protein n=1 Tax=Klebsiella pneumoniae TaxID=573 RepID=UPI00215B6AD8|nr:hypothetical protein [Klebsiella pneumoniae]